MLAAVILTLNEARHITACIASLQWADAVVVLDSYSEDDTVRLAREAGAEVHQHPFENYSKQRNAALELVPADWIFFVDADERATPAVAAEVRQVIAQREEVGWWIPRHNIIFGHRMRGAGWWPDYQLRLLRRDKAYYDPTRAVHEEAILDGTAGYLREPLIHYNYDSLRQFIAKQRKYTNYAVGILRQKGIRPRFYTPYTQAIRQAWWRFVTLHGWRDHVYGLLLSALMGYYEWQTYHRLYREQRKKA